MFDVQTTDPGQLKRIAAAGTGGILLGFFIVGINLVAPLTTGASLDATNVAFGAFGLVAVVTATHPTYQAALALDES